MLVDRMSFKHGLLAALLAVAVWPASSSPAEPPPARAAATCADYPNQKAAQEAADTRDPDGDGIYCESLPCPCSTAAGGGDQRRDGGSPDRGSCTQPGTVQRLVFSRRKYPHIRGHFR